MLLQELADASAAVASTSSRREKVAALADVLRRAEGKEVVIAAHYLAGTLRQRRTGVGWVGLTFPDEAAEVPTATLTEVDAALDVLADLAGPGSRLERLRQLETLLSRLTAVEREYLAGLITGALRQGAGAGLLVDAVAQASGIALPVVRRAAMLAGSLPVVAAVALTEGEGPLAALTVEVFRPVLPMLASSAPSVAEALAKAAPGRAVAIEAKLDGIRLQAHKRGEEVRLYSRSLDDLTERLPGVVDVVRALDADTLVADGEVLGVGADGRPLLFQDTASGTLADGARLSPFFFDALLLDGEPLLDLPLDERVDRLAARVPAGQLVPRIVTDDAGEADAFAREVLDAGHEGVVVKDLAAPYEAGRRGASWVKVKPVHTFDLVVLAVEWGSGRRRGWLSNIHLGARDPATGGFVMLGKTFKGMTDAMLRWQTERFLALETHREGHIVHVRPEQVVEIAIDGLQRSRRYPGGVALRFARVVRYREDKTAAQADTLADVIAGASPGGSGDSTPS